MQGNCISCCRSYKALLFFGRFALFSGRTRFSRQSPWFKSLQLLSFPEPTQSNAQEHIFSLIISVHSFCFRNDASSLGRRRMDSRQGRRGAVLFLCLFAPHKYHSGPSSRETSNDRIPFCACEGILGPREGGLSRTFSPTKKNRGRMKYFILESSSG